MTRILEQPLGPVEYRCGLCRDLLGFLNGTPERADELRELAKKHRKERKH